MGLQCTAVCPVHCIKAPGTENPGLPLPKMYTEERASLRHSAPSKQCTYGAVSFSALKPLKAPSDLALLAGNVGSVARMA